MILNHYNVVLFVTIQALCRLNDLLCIKITRKYFLHVECRFINFHMKRLNLFHRESSKLLLFKDFYSVLFFNLSFERRIEFKF